MKHGKGEFLYLEGYVNRDSYEESWFQGTKHALGTYTYKAENVIHNGTIEKRRKNGLAKYN